MDHGTYPFVTSSSATAGGACTGSGVGPNVIDGVIGIAKAYTTRVGSGPFPTEMTGQVLDDVREKGSEYGATTGRPRRCGWFDAVVVRYACLINQIDTLVVTKLDVLDELAEIKVCTGYSRNGQSMQFFPFDGIALGEAVPTYEIFPGWMQDTSGIEEYEELPERAKQYLARIAELIDTDISIISIGPNRSETIILEEDVRLRRLLGQTPR